MSINSGDTRLMEMPTAVSVPPVIPTSYKRTVTAKQASMLLGVTEEWLIERAKSGHIPYIPAGDATLFEFVELEKSLCMAAENMKRTRERVRDWSAASYFILYHTDWDTGMVTIDGRCETQEAVEAMLDERPWDYAVMAVKEGEL